MGIGQGPFISEPSSVMNIDNIITVTVKSRSEIPPPLGRIRRSSCHAHVDGFSLAAKGLSQLAYHMLLSTTGSVQPGESKRGLSHTPVHNRNGTAGGAPYRSQFKQAGDQNQ